MKIGKEGKPQYAPEPVAPNYVPETMPEPIPDPQPVQPAKTPIPV